MFSLEIYGRYGKIDINGLGGSYGVEKITFFKMLPEMGPPETYSWEYPMKDDSWEYEFKVFLRIYSETKSELKYYLGFPVLLKENEGGITGI